MTSPSSVGWGRSGLSDRQRGQLIAAGLGDLVAAFVLVFMLGGLMGTAVDSCPLDRLAACDSSVEAAFRLSGVGQVVVFGSAAAIAIAARPFRLKLTALVVAPVLGLAVFLFANSTIVQR